MKRINITYKPIKASKHEMKVLRQTEARLNKETSKQLDLVVHATAIALYKIDNWKQERIAKLINSTQEIWDECGASNDLSMVQLCERETGIDLRRDSTDTDYEDIIYLNSSSDHGEALSIYQWIYMRQNQIKWLPAQITACMLIALHRREKWGEQRLVRFLNVFECVKRDYDYNVPELKKASIELTGFELLEDKDEATAK